MGDALIRRSVATFLPDPMRDDAAMLLAELVDGLRRGGRDAFPHGQGARRWRVRCGAPIRREAPAVVAFLSGELRQRQIGVGWSSLKDAPAPADTASLTVAEVDDAFGRIGALSRPRLAGRATRRARRALREPRPPSRPRSCGACCSATCARARSRASCSPPSPRPPISRPDDVRRAHMLDGDLGDVARIALAEGAPGLAAHRPRQVGRPIHPMLAQPADSLDDALARIVARRRRDEARRRAHPGAPLGRRRRALHPHARRRDGAPPGARRGRARAARDRARPRRRGDRAARGRAATSVPGDRVAPRKPHRT